MPHKGASTQHHNQQVLVKLRHQPSERDQQAREKLKQKAKIKSCAYIQLGEEALQSVHKTFAPDIPVILHLPALADSTIDVNTPPTLYVIQERINCMQTTDYFFTSIKPTPIVVTRPTAHHNKPAEQQAATQDPVSQQTHPLQPGETRVYPAMLANKQVPVLNLTKTSITSQVDLQDAFQSLFVFTWWKRKYRRQKRRVTTCQTANFQKKLIHIYIHLRRKNIWYNKRIYTGYTGSIITHKSAEQPDSDKRTTKTA